MLYPVRLGERPEAAELAAAAGGCMLVRREALERAGGIAAIRARDHRRLRAGRAAEGAGADLARPHRRAPVSLRPYGALGEIGRMVSRSAYAQLGYSPLAAGGNAWPAWRWSISPRRCWRCSADGAARWLGLARLALMALAFQPMLRFYRLSPLWGVALPLIGALYTAFTVQSAIEVWRGRGGMWKGRAQAHGGRRHDATPPTSPPARATRDENFPVASLPDRAGAPARRSWPSTASRALADDVADHADAPRRSEKLERLAEIEASLTGEADADARSAWRCARRWPSAASAASTCLDLLEAFRRDVTKLRYADWDELMDYCRYSAAPVGRFVLDVHGEDRATWPANDALCAALQVINHLQDCAKDYRELDRVYLPLDALAAGGASVETCWPQAPRPGPARGDRRPGATHARRCSTPSRPFAGEIARPPPGAGGRRIQRLAESLTAAPVAPRSAVASASITSRLEALGVALLGVGRTLAGAIGARQSRAAGP